VLWLGSGFMVGESDGHSQLDRGSEHDFTDVRVILLWWGLNGWVVSKSPSANGILAISACWHILGLHTPCTHGGGLQNSAHKHAGCGRRIEQAVGVRANLELWSRTGPIVCTRHHATTVKSIS
jgi:hypothetical protein